MKLNKLVVLSFILLLVSCQNKTKTTTEYVYVGPDTTMIDYNIYFEPNRRLMFFSDINDIVIDSICLRQNVNYHYYWCDSLNEYLFDDTLFFCYLSSSIITGDPYYIFTDNDSIEKYPFISEMVISLPKGNYYLSNEYTDTMQVREASYYESGVGCDIDSLVVTDTIIENSYNLYPIFLLDSIEFIQL